MSHKIVAVGASAGGLEALEQFFGKVPGHPGVAFFVIQHLSPDHGSLLAELLTKHCKLPVVEVEDGQQLEPNRVYLLPPGFVPLADGLCVHLRKRSPKDELIHPINSYFESLAQTLGHQAVGVILSGTGMDGTKGAQAIQSAGGRVYVQSPASCKFPGMPQSVISANVGCVVANGEALWAAIESEEIREVALEPGVISMPEDAKEATAGLGLDRELYELIFDRLNGLFGVDFNSYRIASIDRRLCRRIDLLALPDAEAYFDYMKSSDDEAHALYDDLLIGVTEFFRDKDSFRALAKLALAPRLKAHEKDDFRIWVAGCATGEEAYSLYMLADETARKCGYAGRISVFATDIFKPSIDRAGMGSFDKSRLRLVSDERLERYFTEVSSTEYKIRPSVRERVVFAQHNFLADPPFTKMDMVSCRNVLIYLTPESQKLAFKAFCYALVDGGTLFLGASESLGEFSESFKTINAPAKIFEKQNSALDKKRWALTAEPSLLRRGFVMATQTGNAVTINRELLGAYDALISRFKIDGFLISRNREILHYFGDASDFCANATGRVSNDLPSQLDKELRLAVIALAQRAMSKEERVMARKVRTAKGAGHCLVDVSIEPLKDARGNAQVFLVELVESGLAAQGSSDQPGQVVLDAAALEASGEDFEQVQILEEELRATRENLEAANEELQVSNEELQSTNEELYSMNEDLTTLNTEFERKNEDLDELNANHEKLLQSTEDGVLYLDRDLCIRRFNHAIATAFQLLPSDVGRSLTHIAYKLDNINELIDDVRSVLAGGDRVERESIEIQGRHYLKRVVSVPSHSHGIVDSIEGALITFTDITDLSSLNQRFKFAVQAAHMSWWSWDLSSGALSVYSTGDCILGDDCLLDARDRAGWMSQVHPDDRDRVATSLDAHLAGESEGWICEHRFATTAGGWLWVNNRGVVTRRDTAGKALEMMGTTQNIDNYKKALLRANYQNELLEAAGEIIGLGVWEWDPATNLMQYSTRTREILAVDEDYTLTAENGLDFFPQPDRDKLATLFYDLVENGTPYDVEVRCVNANGQHLLTRSAGRPRYDSDGKLTRVVGLFQDITEAIQTEREMRAYFSLSPDFQATLDFDGRFKNFSSSWFKLLGYRPDELVELPLLDVVHPDDRDAFEQKFQAAIGGETISNYQCRILEREGSTSIEVGEALWMSWSMASDASLGMVFISARFVTEERKANQRLEDARIRAEEANRAKSDFLAIMSHELRTPLNPILGFSELLLEEIENPEHQEIVKTIVESGSHLIELINEVLDYSKVEAGKQEAVFDDFSMESLLEEKMRLMRGQLKGKPVEVRSELDKGPFEQTELPLFVGDESMLKHVMRNLISNAIKFTEEGDVVVRVRIDSASEGVADVIFEVKDSGIGIDPAHQEKIFEAFTQADSSMTRGYGGTGLGLAICRRLVELMGGTISVRSELGKGSCFRARIPLRYLMDEGLTTKAPMAASSVADSKRSLQLQGEDGSRKILIVEDNQDSVFFLEKLLTRIGFDPVSTMNGEAALEMYTARDVKPIAILLDLHMPGMDGYATLKAIRAFETSSGLAPIPVFILTADVQEKTRKECLANGANDFITKPVAIDVLRSALTGL